MPQPLTCGTREVQADDGVNIPVPVGGLSLGSTSIIVLEEAPVQITVRTDDNGQTIGYYVVINTFSKEHSEATQLFGELTQEGAITILENLAKKAFTTIAPKVFKAAGLIVGVLATLLTPSPILNETFIQCDLDMGNETSGPPVTYCILHTE